MIGATVLSIVYGYDAKTNDDWMLKVLADGAETLVAGGSLGAHIVDLFPIRKLLSLPRKISLTEIPSTLKCATSQIGSQVQGSNVFRQERAKS